VSHLEPVLEMRPARRDELPAAAHIKASGDAEMGRRVHPFLAGDEPDLAAMTARTLSLLTTLHEENPDQVWVACADGHVAGMAAAVIRGRHGHVVAYFVDPGQQQRGLGGPLFTALLAACRRDGCDVFTLQNSDDPRAMTHYYRHGVRPTLPHLVWAAETLTPPGGPPIHLRAEPIVDEATLQTAGDIDKAVRGVRRLDDLRRWATESTGLLVLDRLSGTPRGYAFLREDHGAVRIGPLAANDAEDVGPILDLALHQAATHSVTSWRIAFPAENTAAIPVLLAWGFRPVWSIEAMATGDAGQFDRYVFHDLNLL
jgi:GNAT superfamily N-acetyltransferase